MGPVPTQNCGQGYPNVLEFWNHTHCCGICLLHTMEGAEQLEAVGEAVVAVETQSRRHRPDRRSRT